MQKENTDDIEQMAVEMIRYAYNHQEEDDSKEIMHQGVELLKQVKEIDEIEMNAENQAERLQVEREKLKSQEHCEETKQKLGWKRTALELAKVIVPGMISGGFLVFLVNKTGTFEETGRWNSQASRLVQNQGPKMKY